VHTIIIIQSDLEFALEFAQGLTIQPMMMVMAMVMVMTVMQIGGVSVPKAVLWLVFFQFLGLAPYSFALERNESVVFVREYMEKVQSMAESSGLPLGDDHNQHMPSFTRGLTGWERTALHSVASVATLSVIAFLYVHSLGRHGSTLTHRLRSYAVCCVAVYSWARRRTRRSFNSFILSRALGEPTGTYPITMENVVRKGDALKIKGEGLKSVRSDVVRLAGLKAVQASVGLLLASTASSYAFTTWVDGTIRHTHTHTRHTHARRMWLTSMTVVGHTCRQGKGWGYQVPPQRRAAGRDGALPGPAVQLPRQLGRAGLPALHHLPLRHQQHAGAAPPLRRPQVQAHHLART
jgi:hypothetical protein